MVAGGPKYFSRSCSWPASIRSGVKDTIIVLTNSLMFGIIFKRVDKYFGVIWKCLHPIFNPHSLEDVVRLTPVSSVLIRRNQSGKLLVWLLFGLDPELKERVPRHVFHNTGFRQRARKCVSHQAQLRNRCEQLFAGSQEKCIIPYFFKTSNNSAWIFWTSCMLRHPGSSIPSSPSSSSSGDTSRARQG